MKTITISYFEVRDIVRFVDNYRGWNHGDIATVESIHFTNGDVMKRAYLDLKPLDKYKVADFGTVPDYFVEYAGTNN